MSNLFTSKSLRNAILGLGAVAAVVTSSPSMAGGYIAQDEVIYAEEVTSRDWRDVRPDVSRDPRWEDEQDYLSARQISRQLRNLAAWRRIPGGGRAQQWRTGAPAA